MLSGKKKQKKYQGSPLDELFRQAAQERVPVKIGSAKFSFTARFLAADANTVTLENPLSHLEDVRGLRNRKLTLILPLNSTLLKGELTLIGLSTLHNLRSLQFSRPEFLVTDEKRAAHRIKELPPHSDVTFSTLDMNLYQGRILDISLRGLGLVLEIPEASAREQITRNLAKGVQVHADALLGQVLKLSFDAEIRYNEDMAQYEHPGVYKIGMRMLNLSREAMGELHQWIFKMDSGSSETSRVALQPDNSSSPPLVPKSKTPNSILVISGSQEHLDYWGQCLGRKYEVITSDFNITNIRQALLTGPILALIHLDPQDSGRASFTRKLCSSFMDTQPIVFFGEEADERRRQILMGNVTNRGYLDTSERKILDKFRRVAEIMDQLDPSGKS